MTWVRANGLNQMTDSACVLGNNTFLSSQFAVQIWINLPFDIVLNIALQPIIKLLLAASSLGFVGADIRRGGHLHLPTFQPMNVFCGPGTHWPCQSGVTQCFTISRVDVEQSINTDDPTAYPGRSSLYLSQAGCTITEVLKVLSTSTYKGNYDQQQPSIAIIAKVFCAVATNGIDSTGRGRVLYSSLCGISGYNMQTHPKDAAAAAAAALMSILFVW